MDKFRVLWSPTALDELKNIYDYLYEQSPKGADTVFDTLLDLGDSLDILPERFPIQPGTEDQPSVFRFIAKWNYKIIYRVNHNAKLVIIATIFGTRQSTDKLQL